MGKGGRAHNVKPTWHPEASLQEIGGSATHTHALLQRGPRWLGPEIPLTLQVMGMVGA